MPASMHLSASSCQPPTSLTVALSLQALAIQLSPAAVASLYTLGKVMHTSAVLPGHQTSTEEHAQRHPHEHIGIDHAQMHTCTEGHAAASPEAASHGRVLVGSEELESGSQPVSAAAAAVHDDLRCGFFSVASVPAARPGE